MLAALHSGATSDLPEVGRLADTVEHWATAHDVGIATSPPMRHTSSVDVEL